jgi:hypothetical protein
VRCRGEGGECFRLENWSERFLCFCSALRSASGTSNAGTGSRQRYSGWLRQFFNADSRERKRDGQMMLDEVREGDWEDSLREIDEHTNSADLQPFLTTGKERWRLGWARTTRVGGLGRWRMWMALLTTGGLGAVATRKVEHRKVEKERKRRCEVRSAKRTAEGWV